MPLKMRWIAVSTLAMVTACSDSEVASANAAAPENTTEAAAVAGADDRSWLSLSGKVVSTSPNTFQLDIGEDIVTVEMDDWDWFNEGAALKSGDEVVVSGRADKDLWQQSKIEASSVFVRNLGVTFHASGADEEDLAVALVQVDPVTATIGTVTAVEGQEFTIGTVTGPVRVDVSQLKARPAIEVGDRVHAWGDLDIDAREKLEIMAEGVAVLSQDKTKRL